MKYLEFTEEQRDEFVDFFYEKLSELGVELSVEDESESPYPWCCPWLWCEDEDTTGETIEEMAYNYAKKHAKEIYELLLAERMHEEDYPE